MNGSGDGRDREKKIESRPTRLKDYGICVVRVRPTRLKDYGIYVVRVESNCNYKLNLLLLMVDSRKIDKVCR